MKQLLLITLTLTFGNLIAQSSNIDWTKEDRMIINGKKFHVVYDEIEINKTVDQVWNEVAGNFMNIGKIVKEVNSSSCLSGDTTMGLGAKRLCKLELQGKIATIKEQIIEFKDCGDHRELTYDVYETNAGPVKSYATWSVRKGSNGKTYLASTFMFRANFGPLTGLVEKQLKKVGTRSGILAYKHFLETGERKVDSNKLNELYPAQ